MSSFDKTEWLTSLEPIKKGKKLVQSNVVRVIGYGDKNSYGVITGISRKRLYFTVYREYESVSGMLCYSASQGHYVDKITGESSHLLILPLIDYQFEQAKQIISLILSQKQPLEDKASYNDLKKTIATMERDTSIPPVWKHETLAKLYQILQELEQFN